MTANNPKRLLEYITLPQCILAGLLMLVFIQANEYPSSAMAAVLILEFLLNIAVVAYYLKNKGNDETGIKVLYAFLSGFLIIFSCGTFLIFNQFESSSVISPETLYILFNSVSMIYLAAAIIKKTSSENTSNFPMLITLCFALPVAAYLLLQSSYTLGDVGIVLAIGLLCVFLLLLGKLIFILYIKNKKPMTAENVTTDYSIKYMIFVAVTAVLFPQAGLLVNSHFFFGENILGDFSDPWFHIIAALNGLLLLVDINKTKYKLPLFYLKTAGFIFIAYFALIFIPYMPYAIIGILFWGLGLLVYVPAVVFVLQTRQLLRDYKLLKNNYRKHIIGSVAAAGLLTLPAILTVNFSIDRVNFIKAMSYVNVDQSSEAEVDFGRLSRSLTQIEAVMLSARQQAGITFMPGTPIITTAYRYIALDNLYFTEGTLSKLRKIFLPETVVSASEVMRRETAPNNVFNTKISVNDIEYDSLSGGYKAWVDFEITELHGVSLSEYGTKFAIPDGCFITDYYLYVGNEKKRGIITDKRAAQVAYESIIRTPKDPGIIYYENDGTINLRVYPFNGKETRKTGFQIMYSQNEELLIEGQTVRLVAENPIVEPVAFDGAIFIPSEYKETLPSIKRQPIYYFLLDAGNADLYKKHLVTAKLYAETKNINSRYYAVSYQANEITDLSSETASVQTKGGFNAAYAMDEIFSVAPDGYFPIIVLVTDNMNRTVTLEKTRLASGYPEVDCYYRLNDDLSLTPYKFSDSQRLREVPEPNIANSLVYDGIVVSAERSETIITQYNFEEFSGNQYTDAFVLQKNTFLADTNDLQVAFIKESMLRRILTKNTAFIVMETKEQEDMLFSLQEQFLSGKSPETPSVMMSEPHWAAFIVVTGIMFVLRRKLLLGGNR